MIFRKTSAQFQFIWRFFRKYKALLWVGIVTLFFIDVLEVFPPLILGWTIDALTERSTPDVFLHYALIYVAVLTFQAVGRYIWRMTLVKASLLTGRDLREEIVAKIFRLPIAQLQRERAGDLVSLSTNDTEAVRMVLSGGVIVLTDAIFYFITIPVAMFWLSPKLTLLTFLPLPLIPYLVFKCEGLIRFWFEKVQENFSQMSAHAQESLAGHKLIQAFVAEEERAGQFKDLGEDYLRKSLKLARIQGFLGPSLDFVMSLSLIMLVWFVYPMIFDGALSVGVFVAFQRFVQKLIWPMEAVGLAVGFYQRSKASSGRLIKLLEQPDENEVLNLHTANESLPTKGSIEVVSQHDRSKESSNPVAIRINHLTFRYPGRHQPAIDDISFELPAGKRLAILGEIGSGKSTLLALLLKFHPVHRGQIFIADKDIVDWQTHELRNIISYVPQDVFLFKDLVSENISLSESEKSVEEAKLVKAATRARIHSEIVKMDEGYSTVLQERGSNLSGGQRQRMGIARALVKNAPLLLVDDSLSAVDYETEAAIVQEFDRFRGQTTELFVSHRVSLALRSDLVIYMHAGRISELGSPAELYKNRGRFYNLCVRQGMSPEVGSDDEVTLV
ncbi:MAG: hypothetical protein COT74_12290 [Bdellovibrionales bacterium CG10_big_fil_rev_8_21_14_0_10_45_34]|nr:MAG: hypothetical protein COT74_12290 [Bdellovibrionales bacterium CG10_big_fil_rev_8_21_14_0_10_45_34]